MAILTINSGSSSLKVAFFKEGGKRVCFNYTLAHGEEAFRDAMESLLVDLSGVQPTVIAHRFVHGGDCRKNASILDVDEMTRLEQLAHLAPLHMPNNLRGVRWCQRYFCCPQVACFDTAFHQTMAEMAWRLPIDDRLGIRKYGFHGLSYSYIASSLPMLVGDVAQGHVLVAHLGSGASLCMLHNLQSIDTTMGFTPAGGLTMATRSGDLDPGIMLALMEKFDGAALSEQVFQKMGLVALSRGESADMLTLLQSESDEAQFAIDYFCRQVRAYIGALVAKVGSIDALVFTGGIGEHSFLVREKICEPLRLFGFLLDLHQNEQGHCYIHQKGSKPIVVMATDEEEMMRRYAQEHIQ
ncbi:MAG: acetate kinase [Zetaproteobacteria bacterium]|nr:acetate kinase [Zetaproteobacteria bacterium]